MIFKTFNARRIKLRGFTLVEMLVYMAVLVLVSGALVTTFLSFDTVFIRNRTERLLANEARTSLEYLTHAIKQADSVNVGQSTLDASPGILALADGATITRFYILNGVLMLEIDGVDVGPLTSDAVTIENVTYNRQAGTMTEMVRVALTLRANNKAASSTRTFYTSAVLRGSYE